MEGLNLLDRSKENQLLFVNKHYLSILCQITLIRLNDPTLVEQTREKIATDWNLFLTLLESKIIKEDPSSTDGNY